MPNDQERPEQGEGKKESLSASGPDLYGAVKGTSTPRLKNGVEKVDVLTPEEEEGMERGGEFVLRATKRRIKVVSMWVLFVFGCIVIGALGLRSEERRVGTEWGLTCRTWW